jgi:hypothetical protein
MVTQLLYHHATCSTMGLGTIMGRDVQRKHTLALYFDLPFAALSCLSFVEFQFVGLRCQR